MTNLEIIKEMQTNISDLIIGTGGMEEILQNYKMSLITQRECFMQINEKVMLCDQQEIKAADKLEVNGDFNEKLKFLRTVLQSGIVNHL